MRHIPDGVLRRLDDEPLAVPDRVTEHVASCKRCGARHARIAEDTEFVARLFSAPQLVPDADMAWVRLRRALYPMPEEEAHRRRRPAPGFRRSGRFASVSARGGLVIAAVAILVAGTAAAATLTTIFAPTHVAAVSLSQSDLRAITAFTGLDDRQVLGGFSTPSGSTTAHFGTVKWSSAGPAHPAASLAGAAAEAGFPVTLPGRLPAGVGAAEQFIVQPRVSATVTFNSAVARLGGSSVELVAGPAILVQYAAASGRGLSTLAVATMPRPTARSSGASVSQIEAFLLNQPGIPPELAEEVRLLGDLRTILPVPVPPGASVHSVQVGGWPGVLLADSSNAAGAVVWEDGRGMLHVVAGILDSQDLLNVANQLG
jgi:hypothetical protein